MKNWVGKRWLKMNGWEAVGERPEASKYVLIAAPHTSNWDLPFMLAISFIFDVQIHWMGKHTLFKSPWGGMMRWLGGVPIERHLRKNVVQQMIELFDENEGFVLAVPAEGPRGLVDFWKSGFYHIAYGADVPLVLAFLDFEKKRGGFGETLHLTGDVKADMDRVRAFYEGRSGKFPERFGPVRLRDEAPFNRARLREEGGEGDERG